MNRFFITILLSLLPLLLCAETVRDITLSADKPYTDNISLAREAGDMDVLVKFSFDEQNNSLTVSMTSYRGLFVFREDARYKQVVRCNKLRMDALPYVVSGEEVPYRLKCKFRSQLKSYTKPLRNFVFRRWITYSGLTPEPMEYQMVNDVISQTFAITGTDRNSFAISLGDVMIMEPKVSCSDKAYYQFLHFASIDTKYRIKLQRNPCFGMEERISVASQRLEAARKAYATLTSTFPDSVITSQENFDLYNKTCKVFREQFPRMDTVSTCPDLQKLNDTYNRVADSIRVFSTRLKLEQEIVAADPMELLTMAYKLDMKVSRWLLTNDDQERKDIIDACNLIIGEADGFLKANKLNTPELRDAYQVYLTALNYYKSTCHIRM